MRALRETLTINNFRLEPTEGGGLLVRPPEGIRPGLHPTPQTIKRLTLGRALKPFLETRVQGNDLKVLAVRDGTEVMTFKLERRGGGVQRATIAVVKKLQSSQGQELRHQITALLLRAFLRGPGYE